MMPSYTGGFRDFMSVLMSDGEKQRILQNIKLTIVRFAPEICKDSYRDIPEIEGQRIHKTVPSRK